MRRGTRDGRDGMALLLALLFVAVLSAIVIEYAYETQVEASLAGNRAADLEAYVAAKSGIANGMALLAGDLLEFELYIGRDFDSLIDLWAMGFQMQPINNAIMRCSIDDEYGKINLNALIAMDENGVIVENELLIGTLRMFFEMRMQMFDLEENPTDAILDWLDPDSEPREFGAESDWYAALEIPYPCKNGPMDSIDELLMVFGITPELYFAILDDPSQNQPNKMFSSSKKQSKPVPGMPGMPGLPGMPGGGRGGAQAQQGLDMLPLPELLTVHGSPRGLINVNTAEPEVLDALFQIWPLADPTDVELILTRQMDQLPFMDMGEVAGLFGKGQKGDWPPEDVLTVKSDVFRLFGDGQSEEVRVRIEAYVWRNPGQGMTDTGGGAMEAFRILDWRVIR